MTVAVDEEAEIIKQIALADEKIIALLSGAKVLKVIYVPKKLVNIVVAQ
jgi:leucyl-tRNA synthetase